MSKDDFDLLSGSGQATRVDDDGTCYDEQGNPIADPNWVSEEEYLTHEALDEGDRGAALELWKRVADGRRSETLDWFVKEVACRLLEADRHKQDRRRDEILKAVGLKGDLSPNLARDRRIAELLGRPAREIWATLAAEGLYQPGPNGEPSEPVPSAIEKAISRVRVAVQAWHKKAIEGLEDLSNS